jgi:hypothetical protein
VGQRERERERESKGKREREKSLFHGFHVVFRKKV